MISTIGRGYLILLNISYFMARLTRFERALGYYDRINFGIVIIINESGDDRVKDHDFR
jgi:hypothetical protein